MHRNLKRMKKSKDQVRLLKKLWNMAMKVIFLVMGAFGTTPRKLKECIEKNVIEKIIDLNITTILYSARFL